MTRHLDADRILEDWLADLPNSLPDRVVNRLVDELDRTPQWRRFGLPRREEMNRVMIAAGSAAAVVLVAAIGIGLLYGGSIFGPAASPSPTPSPIAIPESGDLAPGRYLYDNGDFTTVPFTLTLNGEGWLAGASNINKVTPSGEISFASSILHVVFADACVGTNGELLDAGTTVDDLVNALNDMSGPIVEGPEDVTVGGYSGKRLHLMSPPIDELVDCNIPDALQVWQDESQGYFVVTDAWVYIVDVDGNRVVLTIQDGLPGAAGVAELEAIIESIEFQP